jgi:hypothetical protein
VASNDVDVRLLLDIKEATQGVTKFTSQLKVLAGVAAAAFAGVKIVGFIKDVVDAASEAEDAISGFNNALALSGNFSKEASKDFQDFASEIQRSTKFSDDFVLQIGGLIENLTALDTEGLKRATKATLDFSVATGKDARVAAQLLAQAQEGMVSGFTRYGIVVEKGKTNTESFNNALKALEKFAGSAEGQLKTFSGSVAQLQGGFGDFQKALGFLITQNPAVILGINALAKIFFTLADRVNENRDAFIAYVNRGVVFLLRSISPMLKGLSFLIQTFDQMVSLLQLIEGLLFKVVSAATRFNPFLKALSVFNKDIADNRKAFIDTFDGMADGLLESAGNASQFSTDLTSAIDSAAALTDTVVEGTIQQIEVQQKQNRLFEANIANQTKAIKTLSAEQQKANNVALSKSPLSGILGGAAENFTPGGSAGQEGIARAAGIVNSVLKGAEGAAKLLSGVVSGLVDTILPGLGAVAGEIFEVFAQGPDKVKEMVTSFISALPDILVNVVKAIPALIEALVASLPTLVKELVFALIEEIPNVIIALIQELPNLIVALIDGLIVAIEEIIDRVPEIIEAFIEKIPDIISNFIQQLPRIIYALTVQLPQLLRELTFQIIAQLPNIAAQFITELVKQTPRLISEMVNQFKKFITGTGEGSALGGVTGAAKGLVGGVGGIISGVGKSIGKIFGFADGGVVPQGFPGDTFPARLTSGEFVVNNDLTRRLDQFLSGSGAAPGGGAMQVTLVVGEAQLAQVLVNLNKQGFRVS